MWHENFLKNNDQHHERTDTVDEVTDSCAQQYKSRVFFGWLTERKTSDMKIIVQIYWDSGHWKKSKGDGAGGTLKVQLNQAVTSQQKMFTSVKDVYDC